MPHLVNNERLKLRATMINTIGIAFIVVGFVTPVATSIYGTAVAPALSSTFFLLITLGWIVGGAALHFVAVSILGGLRE
jgi:hypothetical protein